MMSSSIKYAENAKYDDLSFADDEEEEEDALGSYNYRDPLLSNSVHFMVASPMSHDYDTLTRSKRFILRLAAALHRYIYQLIYDFYINLF